jgi:ribosome maturation protein SDO1
VLQASSVFVNVSKGVIWKKDELVAAFGTDEQSKIITMVRSFPASCVAARPAAEGVGAARRRQILDKGELQVSEKERSQMLTNIHRDIATVVADKVRCRATCVGGGEGGDGLVRALQCVDPNTQRPLTVGIVERAMREIHYSVNLHRSAKQQALEVIRLLKSSGKIPIERAQMQLKIAAAERDSAELRNKLKPLLATVQKQQTEPTFECVRAVPEAPREETERRDGAVG